MEGIKNDFQESDSSSRLIMIIFTNMEKTGEVGGGGTRGLELECKRTILSIVRPKIKKSLKVDLLLGSSGEK